MYEELVKRLRDDNAWKNCDFDFIYGLMHQAADAIEDLQTYESLYQELAEKNGQTARNLIDAYPRWISVEERLPEDGEEVLCYYEYFRYGSFNRIYKTIDRGYFLRGRFGGEPTNGQKARVLYWMPLPEPPKEET